MKKIIIGMLLSTFTLTGTTVIAQSEEIDNLLSKISSLETELKEKKRELSSLIYGDESDEIEWIELNIRLADEYLDEPAINILESVGVDYSGEIPEIKVVHYVKNQTSQQVSPNSLASGSLMVETDEFTDFASGDMWIKWVDKIDGNYIETENPPSKVAPGWEGYRLKSYLIEEPNGAYHYVDNILGGMRYKIAIYGTEEPTGTRIPTGFE